jgi:outer membrane protein
MVDLQRAVDESSEGKAAKSRLQAEYDRRQRELDGELDALKQRLEESPSRPELLERELTLEKRGQKLQREFDEKQAVESARILKRLKAVIGQVAQARKVDWVLDRSSVLFAPPGPTVDLTDEVVRRANQADLAPPAQ